MSISKIKEINKTTKAQELVAISIYKDKCGHFDFGNFPSDYKIIQYRTLWKKYLDIRMEFEIVHDKLIKMARRKYRNL